MVKNAIIALFVMFSASVAHAEDSTELVRKMKRSPMKAEKSRPKYLSGEATAKKGAANVLDFGEAQIDGGTKAPMMSGITGGREPAEHDFIKVRLRWHPEMVASTSAIE